MRAGRGLGIVRPSALARFFWPICVALFVSFGARVAHAQSLIKRPGVRPQYTFELEPHVVMSPFSAPDDITDDALGLGVRGTIEVLPDGFLPKVNDSVGIGFGLDWLRYQRPRYRGVCERFVPGAGGLPVCVATDSGHGIDYVLVPVVMQWNFWLHPRWSVFGEPGLALYHRGDGGGFGVSPLIFAAGGRFHFTDHVSLTLRLGYPTVSLGVSFLM